MWWNGRHRGLKIPCLPACGFESRHQHHGFFPAAAGNFYFSYIFHEKQALSVMLRRLLYVFFLSVSILILTKFVSKYRPVRHTRLPSSSRRALFSIP